ncbi:MAG: LptF/LptG family permease [Planctomycetota bacterium]|nr:LptF/LptG family permease [Planctomycetota bacterium]
MLIIDRYVLRLYLKVLIGCFLSLTGLFIIIDLFSNLDKFQRIVDRDGSWPALLCAYYGPRALTFFDRTSPLMALVAATFAISSLQRSNELAALMAAGIPKIRVVRSLIIGAIAVSLFAAVCRESLIPAYRERLLRNAKDWRGDNEQELNPRYDNRTDILIAGRYTIAAERRIGHPQFRLPRGLGRFGSQLVAENAYYRPPVGDRPGGYLMAGVRQPERIADIPSVYVKAVPILLTRQDTAWLEPDQCFVVSDVLFEQLSEGNDWRQFSPTRELLAGLRNPSLDYGADVRVTVHARFLQPFLDMTLFFLGLPLVISRENRNVFVAIGLCALVVAIFFVVVLACQTLGSNYLLPPALAAWCPLLIFVPAARVIAQSLWR